jgi:hypothetical protein
LSAWAVDCPVCGTSIDSHDSYADSKADLKDHISLKHPNVDLSGIDRLRNNLGELGYTPIQISEIIRTIFNGPDDSKDTRERTRG